ncbi:hypothetical protein PAP_03825 [Palaeococcus pacificus DY20341]|uniref:DUF302 domain-containing protein n=1 Tax=Palaeococcus pacificus DY20341 TaxID=1343739 RepID=A0A075LX95_9EURY|nr:DUF302 domain-containing protein [Palaeococcus pacificus]AIF69183.1 hypothetical protein PAP_03825 [Palaeococcus pacificus DY20341]
MIRFAREVSMNFDDAEKKFKEELEKEGFKVVLELPTSEIIKNKVGVEMEPYKIMYVCNPKKFYELTKENYEIGSFAPCPVLLYQKEGKVYFALNTPEEIVELIKEPLEIIKGVIERV